MIKIYKTMKKLLQITAALIGASLLLIMLRFDNIAFKLATWLNASQTTGAGITAFTSFFLMVMATVLLLIAEDYKPQNKKSCIQ
jgi:hypothetical protein